MNKKPFQPKQVFNLLDVYDQMQLCRIASNRMKKLQINRKLKSCEENGMLVPGIFADAALASAAGFKLIDVQTGKELSKEESEDYYVILEGNTRFHAFCLALEKAKKEKNYKPFDYKFFVQDFADPDALKQAYLSINVDNEPTRGDDHVRTAVALHPNLILESYQQKTQYGLAPKAAAIATIGREIPKDKLTDFVKGKSSPMFKDEETRRLYEPIYEAAKTAFGSKSSAPKALRGSELWKYNARKMNEAKDKALMTEKLIKLYLTLPSGVAFAIDGAKKSGIKTKEEVVAELLEGMFEKI